MFFLARATLCIGLVALAASQAGGGGFARALDHDARDTAASVGRACLAAESCLRLGTSVLAAAGPSDPGTVMADPTPERPISPTVRTGGGRHPRGSAVHTSRSGPAAART